LLCQCGAKTMLLPPDMPFSDGLENFLKEKIRHSGSIKISDFMGYALAHPAFGYYMTRDPFGAAGDFTTAPEISQMFGEMIAVWLMDAWQKMGAPKDFILLECGPGRGTLMADILRVAKVRPEFIKAARITLLEISPVLREIQVQRLADYKVLWVDTLNQIPANLPLLCVANEFFDALPIRQFQYSGSGWMERKIGFDGEAFFFTETHADEFKNFPVVHEGGIVEILEAGELFMSDLSARIHQSGGAALVIDYGYEGPAVGDTLQALYQHSYCKPLEHIGRADLTAHVDFSALKAAALDAGVQVSAVKGQGAFLKSLGFEARAKALMTNASEKQAQDIQNALHRLTDSSEMGELFKVMGVFYGFGTCPAGF